MTGEKIIRRMSFGYVNSQYLMMASLYCGCVVLVIYFAWDTTIYANQLKPNHPKELESLVNRSNGLEATEGLKDENITPNDMTFQRNKFSFINKAESSSLKLPSIPLVLVVCRLYPDEEHETFKYMSVYLKALAIFNTHTVNIILIMNQGEEVIKKITGNWSREYTQTLNITIVPPDEQLQDSSGGCQAHKMYLDQMFPLIDSVIVSNLDVIFLRPLESLFKEFETAPAEKIIGYTENQKISLNCGLVLLNLSRMRDINIPKPTIEKNMEKSEYDKQITAFLNAYETARYNVPVNWNVDSEAYKNSASVSDKISALHGCENSFIKGNEFFNVFQYFEVLSLNISKREIIELFIKEVENKNICAASDCGENFEWDARILYYPKMTYVKLLSK